MHTTMTKNTLKMYLSLRHGSNEKKQNNMKDKNKFGMGMAIGIAIGTAIGVALDNIAIWVAIGVALGAGIGRRLNKKKSRLH